MKLRKSKNRAENESLLPLVLPAVEGTPIVTFPGEVVDSLRLLLTQLDRSGELPKRIALVAALRGEGVTYLSQALGTVLGSDLKARICIVELNWWWPQQSALVALDNEGLAAVAEGRASLEDVIAPTGLSNVAFVPAGRLMQQNRHAMARSQDLRGVLDQLSKRFDHLILDIPAILATSDAVPLAATADVCAVVIQQGVTASSDVRKALDQIDHLNVSGVLLNKVRMSTPASLAKLLPASG